MSFDEVIGIISSINECVNFFQWAASSISSLRSKWTTVQQNHEQILHLQSDLHRLRESLPAMYNLIDRAEWKSHDPDIAKLLPWLKDAVYDADDLLDEFRCHELKLEVEGSSLDSSFHEFFVKVIRGNYSRVKEIQKRLDNFSGQLERLRLCGAPQRFDKSVRPETSSLPNEAKIFGRQKELKEVMELLGVSAISGRSGFKRKRGNGQATASISSQASCGLDDIEANQEKFSVLSIVGIGGVGKTTLAQHISNHPRVKSHFKLIVWTCVSDEFDTKRLTKELIQSLSGKDIASDNLDCLQRTLKNIVDKKKILLILDDMWDDVLKENGQRWKNFCAPFADVGQGSKILVTTRSAEVADRLSIMEPFPLDGLKAGVFWDFFKLCAFGSQDSNNFPELEHIGKSIVTKLKGSPLAAKTLGRLLRRNFHTIHWNNILKSELWELKQEETDILPALRLSYMYLPPHLKKCFSFCAVYPKDHIFEKEKLARIWAAEGFVEPQSDIPIEDLSCQYFEDLTSRSFFQALPRSLDKFVIHDLMHDVAQLVSKDECFIIRDLTDLKKVPPNVRHLSIFTNSNVDSSNLQNLHKYKKLRTLLCNDLFKNKEFASVVDNWFSGLEQMRVFSCSFIKKLPDSVGNLKHLRYLGISKTCPLKTLPLKFFSLYNLQFLIAERCQFESLPCNMRTLISLLRIESKTLRFFPGGDAAAFGQGIKLSKHISSSHGKLILGDLGQLRNKDDAVEAELHMKHLDTVSLRWRSPLDKEGVNGNEVEVLEALCPPSNIKSLNLCYYPGRSMASWFQPHNLPNLTSINFWECNGMEEIFSVLVDNNNVSCVRLFSSLTEISIYNCEKLSSLEILQPVYVPSMKNIKVEHCRNLVSVPTESFRDFCFLEELVISSCPITSSEEMLRLPLSLKMLKLERSGGLSYAIEGLSLANFYYSCSYVEVIPIQMWGSNLPALEKLEIKSCKSLESIQRSEASSFYIHGSGGSDIPITFSSLTNLSISYCEKLTSLDGFLLPDYLPAIKRIQVDRCRELLTLPGEKLHGFLQLEVLILSGCPRLNWQRGSVQFPSSLQELSLVNCGDLSMWVPSCLQNLTSLVSLTLISCPSIESIPSSLWSSNIETLQDLYISDCPDLVSIEGPKIMEQIADISIRDCSKLKRLRQPFCRGKYRKRNWWSAASTK